MGQRSRWPKWGWSSLGWISLMGLALVGTACERSPSNTQTSDLTAPCPRAPIPCRRRRRRVPFWLSFHRNKQPSSTA